MNNKNEKINTVKNKKFENKIITIEGNITNFETKTENPLVKINCLGYVGKNDESYVSNWISFNKNFKSNENEKFIIIAVEDLEKILINVDKLIENNNGHIVEIGHGNILKLEAVENKFNEKEIKLYETDYCNSLISVENVEKLFNQLNNYSLNYVGMPISRKGFDGYLKECKRIGFATLNGDYLHKVLPRISPLKPEYLPLKNYCYNEFKQFFDKI